MILIGITGQSGTGTSTVGEILAEQGVLFLNADAVYHRLLAEDAALSKAITAAFGSTVLEGGRISRKALAARVFEDPAALAVLNGITHDRVLAEIRTILAETAPEAAAVEAVALFESGFAAECTHTLAVIASEAVRLSRIMTRDGLSKAAAKARMAAQKEDAFYTVRAGFTIENNATAEALREKVLAFWQNIRRQ